MDLSKLPRLSKTQTESSTPSAGGVDAPDAPDAPVAASAFCNGCGAPLRPGARFCDSCGAPAGPGSAAPQFYAEAGVGVEVWLSALIGIVLMLVGRSFGSYLLATLTGQPFHTNVIWQVGPKEGQEVGYWELQGYTALSDSAIFLFGLTMVLESIVLALVNTRFRAKAGLVTIALLFTVLVTIYNAVAALALLTTGLPPYTSLLAVAFGGYIAVFEWRLLQQLRPRSRASGRT